jgi:hypothetical protein
MGTFLSLTSVVGKTQTEVANSLRNYALSVGGGLEKEDLPVEHDNCCVLKEANGNTSIFYPHGYLEWDASAAFISRELGAPVFSFHIHDGDLWMYLLFVNGNIVDQFNPLPDYWDDNLSKQEMQSWKGNAKLVSSYFNHLQPASIEKYLVRWDLEAEETIKAYAADEFEQEDWQLLDFMKKLQLPYPLKDDGTANGEGYKLYTKELKLGTVSKYSKARLAKDNEGKPWWKFW